MVEGFGLCKGCRLLCTAAPVVAFSFSSEEVVSRFGAEGLGLCSNPHERA